MTAAACWYGVAGEPRFAQSAHQFYTGAIQIMMLIGNEVCHVFTGPAIEAELQFAMLIFKTSDRNFKHRSRSLPNLSLELEKLIYYCLHNNHRPL